MQSTGGRSHDRSNGSGGDVAFLPFVALPPGSARLVERQTLMQSDESRPFPRFETSKVDPVRLRGIASEMRRLDCSRKWVSLDDAGALVRDAALAGAFSDPKYARLRAGLEKSYRSSDGLPFFFTGAMYCLWNRSDQGIQGCIWGPNSEAFLKEGLADLATLIESVADGAPKGGQAKSAAGGDAKSSVQTDAGKQKRNVNGRMLDTLQRKPESRGWTVREWAAYLGCSTSSVCETQTWKELSAARKVMKAERSKDRRRRTKGR